MYSVSYAQIKHTSPGRYSSVALRSVIIIVKVVLQILAVPVLIVCLCVCVCV